MPSYTKMYKYNPFESKLKCKVHKHTIGPIEALKKDIVFGDKYGTAPLLLVKMATFSSGNTHN
jgi:hypothetical protein